jgi:hypothetical protein
MTTQSAYPHIEHAGEETLITSAYPLLDEMAAKSGWDDPTLDIYNDLIPRDRQ